ncbi:RNA ligase family protein [Brevibacillus sp. SYSU BS000544]|uniref:RNA ligase family protein n=1 Tax=Brevibacillus sp. SYSU BS000544 TaxID=3416443 RepID=UPI003CE455D2
MKTKYPRTLHLPWSRSKTDDDKILKTVSHFEGREIVVTEKLDGENTTMYRDSIHARSLDSNDHDSRHWVKKLHGMISFHIPEGWRICGENVFAKHSIHYEKLTSYFYIFSIWDEYNQCLPWNETVEWATLLGVEVTPVLYKGVWNEQIVKSCFTRNSVFAGEQEGYVVRVTDRFLYDDFKNSVAKFVRKNHVQTDEHWLSKPVVPNGLK